MYYKVPIVDGIFVGVNYDDIIEGVAYARHVEDGYGYVHTDEKYDFREVTEEQFSFERGVIE